MIHQLILVKCLQLNLHLAGTLTTLPWIYNCPPLGRNLSSKDVKFKHCGFTGNPILFNLEQSISFPLHRFEWQVEQIHFVLFILVVVVIQATFWNV